MCPRSLVQNLSCQSASKRRQTDGTFLQVGRSMHLTFPSQIVAMLEYPSPSTPTRRQVTKCRPETNEILTLFDLFHPQRRRYTVDVTPVHPKFKISFSRHAQRQQPPATLQCSQNAPRSPPCAGPETEMRSLPSTEPVQDQPLPRHRHSVCVHAHRQKDPLRLCPKGSRHVLYTINRSGASAM